MAAKSQGVNNTTGTWRDRIGFQVPDDLIIESESMDNDDYSISSDNARNG